MKEEIIGKVKLNYSWYSGEDLYSDGDAVENRILEIVRNEEGYEFALDEYTSWPILYHLTRQRENIVLPMEIGKTDEVLEVGAGMGAVTGALARKAKKVDCIELSRRRSLVNAERHKDLDNIEIFVGNFRDIRISRKYDAVVLIGVLEYAVYYVGGENPYETFLRKIAECLKPGGKLMLSDVEFAPLRPMAEKAGFRILFDEDLSVAWKEYYIEALWRGETCDCELPKGKCGYRLLIAEKEE